jgi:type VI secretion system protein ImpB
MAIQDEIPKSRLTLKYKTEVQGEPEDITLPLRLMVTNDFSLGTSKDRKVDLEERRIRNMNGRNTDAVMRDMGMRLNYAVANKIDPDKSEDIQVDLPIDSIKSFNPEEIAKNVPKVKGLLALKELLEEVISNVDNRKEFRKLLNDLMANEEALNKLKEELKAFEGYQLPSGEAGESES